VIARHRKIRRRRVAGALSLVVVCAGIGVPLGLSGPGGKPPQHHPG
jgi:ferric-dicitrate binding protein FerR (iron transport regulator)